MKRPHSTTRTPDRILAAAARVVLRDSVRRLTLEKVAREAKLSTGGVLYHFAAKEALIQAMLARLIQSCAREMEGPRQDAEPGRWTRAYVRRTFAPVWPYPGEDDLPSAIEAGLAPSWAAGVARDGKDEKTAPTEAVGCIWTAGREGKMEILVQGLPLHLALGIALATPQSKARRPPGCWACAFPTARQDGGGHPTDGKGGEDR